MIWKPLANMSQVSLKLDLWFGKSLLRPLLTEFPVLSLFFWQSALSIFWIRKILNDPSSCSFPILSLLSLLSLCVRLLHEWSPTKSGLLRSNMAKLLQRLSLELVVQTPKTRRGSTAVWWETSNLRWTSMLVSLLFLMAPEPLKFLSWSHRTCWQLCYRSTPGCFWVAARLVRNLKDWSCRFGVPTERSILRMTFSNMIEPDSLGQFLWRFMVMVEERKRNSHWRYFPSSPPSDSTVLVAENHAVAAAR